MQRHRYIHGRALFSNLAILAAIIFLSPALQAQTSKKGKGTKATLAQKELTLQLDEQLKVRSIKPPVHLDDAGKPKKLSADDLKELRGTDSKVPGYARDLADLKAGQSVQVYLSRLRAPSSTKKDKDAEDEKSDEKADVKSNKSRWVSLGQLTGTVTKLPSKGSKASKHPKKLHVRVEYVKSSGQANLSSGTNGGLGDDVFITMIVIVTEPAPAKDK